jgi:internalin A
MERLTAQLNKIVKNSDKKLNVNRLVENGTGSVIIRSVPRTYISSKFNSVIVSNSNEKILLAEEILQCKYKSPVKQLPYLPPEILLNIFKYLPLKDLKEVEQVEQFDYISKEIINERLLESDEPDSVPLNIKRLKYTGSKEFLYKLENFTKLKELIISDLKVDVNDIKIISKLKQLKSLDVSSNSFTLKLNGAEECFKMTNLKHLNIRLNYINFPSISLENNLESLDISRNFLNEIDILKISTLSNLKSLKFSNLTLNIYDGISIDYRPIYTMANLRSLHLDGLFKNRDFELLSKMKLYELYIILTIDKQDIEYFISNIIKMSTLTHLKITHANLTNIHSDEISKMTNLTLLNLSFNRINSIEKLMNMPKLLELSVNNNSIKNIDQLPHYSTVKKLDISNNNLTNNGKFISKMNYLYSLNLSSTKLNSVDIKYVSTLFNLRYLDISSTSIGVRALLHLSSMDNLICLDIDIPYLLRLNDIHNN